MKSTTKRMIKNGNPVATGIILERYGGQVGLRQWIANALKEARRLGKQDIARRALLRGWSFGLKE